MAGTYENPEWNNDTSPAMDADNMNNLSNAVVQNQTDIAELNTMLADYSSVKSLANEVPTVKNRIILRSTTVSCTNSTASGTAPYGLGYLYYGDATGVSGVATGSFISVALRPSDAIGGNIAPFVTIESGKVRFYAKNSQSVVVIDRMMIVAP